MTTFAIETTGIDDTAHWLDHMGDRATQLAPVFDKLLEALTEGEKTLFERNGGGGRNAWPPNTKLTLARKIARGQGDEPMRATGATFRGLTELGAEGQIAYGGGTTLYFGVHSKGAAINRNLDRDRKREVLKLLPSTRKTVRQIILDHITEGSE